ncbi:hypothetical protein MLD38_022263 [Melastoma candidum]|uniref:Uncharacterized protein n=1 Tax=Melastoma candidum TaxID=119954 RepID=A0ACB9QJQ1_9MYRT|nr:hypothetical protein MLD38_022263 [Melastoma candidum]
MSFLPISHRPSENPSASLPKLDGLSSLTVRPLMTIVSAQVLRLLKVLWDEFKIMPRDLSLPMAEGS